jgi:hypothetical protein
MTQQWGHASNLVSFDSWIKSLGRARCTGYRWRKDGLVDVVNIFGKWYISREEITRFEKRAVSGAFHQEAQKPNRPNKSTL